MSRDGQVELFDHICADMWSVTPYPLCSYRCTYCVTSAQGDSRTSLTPQAATIETERWLRSLPSSRLLILGAYSDAYPPVEDDLGVTRAVLEVLVASDDRICIVTKGDVVLRDIELLRRSGERCEVQISLSSLDDDTMARLDLQAPPPSRRLDVIHELHAAGVHVAVNALPWIPGVTDARAIIDAVPPDVEIVFSPLAFGPQRHHMRLDHRTYRRDDVWDAYLAEYRRLGHVPNTSWVRPKSPPNENHPLFRLPDPACDVPVPAPVRTSA